MVDWSQLLLPILLSTALVFVASSLIHMVLKFHDPEYLKLSNEDEVRAVVRAGSPSPGQYVIPQCSHGKGPPAPETLKKFEEGPVAVVYVRPTGMVKLGPFLGKWIVYVAVVSALTAYVARSVLHPGEPYLNVFRLVGATAWLAYGWQSPADSIWMGKPWIVTVKFLADALVFALLTAGTFAWLWPR